MIKSIPLNKLVQSPRNVRRHSDPAADAELKASIAARGLLQNLIVRPAAKGKFEVEAGERRRRAMLALAEEKLLARDQEVTCLVLEDSAEAAVETSLAENFHRLAMNPADEAQAFAELVSGGATVEDVARRFGLTVRFVEGRLRLATLAPVVFEALASGEITLDIAKAFGATLDQEIQTRVFEQVSSAYYAPNPDSVRRMVLSGTVRGSDPRARLIGRDAYVAAGGRIERELFDNDDSESWVDVALLESLAAAKMEEQAQALAAEQGLAWVKATLDPYASHDLVDGLIRLPAEPAPLGNLPGSDRPALRSGPKSGARSSGRVGRQNPPAGRQKGVDGPEKSGEPKAKSGGAKVTQPPSRKGGAPTSPTRPSDARRLLNEGGQPEQNESPKGERDLGDLEI